MLALLTLIGAAWGAEALALVEVSEGGLRVLSAQIVDDAPSAKPPPGDAVGELLVVDAAGQRLSATPVPDPRRRSVVFPEGGGAELQLERGVVSLRLPWPEGAQSLALGAQRLSPARAVQPPNPTAPVGLIETGPADQRLDILILGDGYTAEEQGRFADDAERMMRHLLNVEPYGDYAGLINAWREDAASEESGVSHREDNPQLIRDTYYGCYYGCGGVERAVCCDDAAVLGQIAESLPDAEGVVVLVNDPEYGGAGGFQYATSYTADPWGEYVFAHELGHSLIGLWDEYSYGYDNTGEGPNCAAASDGSAWAQWLDEERISAFPTCTFNNLYRPTDQGCMMNTLQDGYCPVCREQVVLGIYDHLPALVQGVEPEPGPIALTEATRFAVEVLEPTEGAMSRRWSLAGVELSTEDVLVLEPCGPSGELVHEAWDPTPWVRVDPYGLLQETVRWQIERPPCQDSGLDSAAGSEPQPKGGCACGGAPAPWGAWLVAASIVAILQRRRLH